MWLVQSPGEAISDQTEMMKCQSLVNIHQLALYNPPGLYLPRMWLVQSPVQPAVTLLSL